MLNVILDGYVCTDIDDDSEPKYYGFTRPDGSWVIMKITLGATVRYARGSTGYTTNWTAHTTITYYYWYEVM